MYDLSFLAGKISIMTIILEQHNSIPSIQDIDSIENWTMIFSNPLKRKKFPYQEQILNRYNKLGQKSKYWRRDNNCKL